MIVTRDWTRMAEREEAKLANVARNSGEDERHRKGKP
jgi:hypothetical protein